MDESALPSTKSVRDMLEELLGRNVDLQSGPPVVPSRAVPAAVGVYVVDGLRLRAIAVADLPLAAHAGASIGLVPRGGAEASVEDGELAATLSENFAEIVNVMAALFNLPGLPHVKLDGYHPPGDTLAPDVAALSGAYVNRLDLAVAIAGYGGGGLSFVLP